MSQSPVLLIMLHLAFLAATVLAVGNEYPGSAGFSGSASAPSWQLLGDAAFDGEAIRLTTDSQNKVGIAVARNASPLLVDGWRVDALFRLHGAGLTLVGDGVGLWYTRDALYVHPGGILGANPRFAGVVVLLRTYVGQNRPPRLSLVANDGTEILYSSEPGVYQTSLHPAACCDLDRLLSGDALVGLRLDVRRGGRAADLYYVVGSAAGEGATRSWTPCVSVADLGVQLEPRGALGVSAATGDLSQAHDLVELIIVHEVDKQAGGVRLEPQRAPEKKIVRTTQDSAGRTVDEVVSPSAAEMDGSGRLPKTYLPSLSSKLPPLVPCRDRCSSA